MERALRPFKNLPFSAENCWWW